MSRRSHNPDANRFADEADYPDGPVDLTPSQKRALVRIRSRALDRASNGGLSDAEIKRFEVKDMTGHRIAVLIEAGHVGDENDLRSVFCRTRGHFFVGSHGGIEIAAVGYSRDYEGKRTKARKRPLIWGFSST